MNTYVVKAGDTLAKIAAQLGVDVKALAQVNAIKDPNKISVGKSLVIPNLTTDLQDLAVEANVTHEPVIDRTTFRLPTTEFANETSAKDLIMLHFTASSSAQSVFNAWMAPVNGKPYRVATAYVVDRDGKIYEFFPPEKWAWHLGMTGNNPNSINDRRAVAIEIVNVGGLQEDATNKDQLNWWPNNYKTRWCSKTEKDRYVKATYRGINYFAAFPGIQVTAVHDLVHHLAAKFNIPKTLPPAAKLNEFDPVFFSAYKGIASHQNYRPDKTDMGPAWNWSSLGI